VTVVVEPNDALFMHGSLSSASSGAPAAKALKSAVLVAASSVCARGGRPSIVTTACLSGVTTMR
jgi:hypothetical protein